MPFPAFSTVEEYGKELRPVRLTTGPVQPVVVCFSSFVALAGVHQYARLAAAFRGERDVWALSVPGFLKDERLPRSREVVTRMQAEAVREAVGDTPFVLMGSSGGGLMAHAAASILEESGTPASAVVLLDTYPATEDSPLVKFEADLIDGMFDREQFTALDASRLTAMSRYFTCSAAGSPASSRRRRCWCGPASRSWRAWPTRPTRTAAAGRPPGTARTRRWTCPATTSR